MDARTALKYAAGAGALYAGYKLAKFVRSDCDLALGSCSLAPDAFKGKVVWVTGASSGIGEQLALLFAQQGAQLVLSSRRREALEAVQTQCGGAAQAKVVPLDLADLDSLPAKAEEALRCFGRIDVLVNNGGVSTRALAQDTDFAVDQKVAVVDYLGQVRVTKAVLPHFIERRSGQIINISSVAGKAGVLMRTAYCGAKFALLGWMDALRVEMRAQGLEDIHICNVCPGPVATNVALNALTADGSRNDRADPLIDNGVRPQRCAWLILAGAANHREELWIAKQPILTTVYLAQYFPERSMRILATQSRKMLRVQSKQ
eukprot:TRINITY_DN51206_c0_g1_i1.p2 TRINITY_DN51206_c0_g1~~TRINITY_DN51206_c0_g1_i1.p2  ORF type:complete len:342 (+),score=105.81 TRINITY_DN51206_c0_g1_i1:77-1027(+)